MATMFEMCGCALCAGQQSQLTADDAGSGGGGGGGTPDSAPTAGFTHAQIINQLTTRWTGDAGNTRTWQGDTVTFSLADATPTNVANHTPTEGGTNLVVMTPLMKDIAREAFELWDDLIDIDIVESVNNTAANITFNYSSNTDKGGSYSSAWWSGTTGNDHHLSADQIWLNSGWASHDSNADTYFGGYLRATYVHEIGHSLGLSHPGLYNAGSGGTITYNNNAEYTEDTRKYTVMSYFGGWRDANGDGVWEVVNDGTDNDTMFFPQTPMVHDILAIQSKYGADMTTRTGDTHYGFYSNAGRSVFDFFVNNNPILTIWDAGGANDWLNVSGWGDNQVINLKPGEYSSVNGMIDNIGIAYGTWIENAMGGWGSDTMIGNSQNNVLDGYLGADTMSGMAGNDIYYVDQAGDSVIEYALVHDSASGLWLQGGTDRVYSKITYTLGANVENLMLHEEGGSIHGYGNNLNNVLDGNGYTNWLYGYDGNDVLNGRGGYDYMNGGLGDDIYYVDNASDTLDESTGNGNDWVYAYIDWALEAGFENLYLMGSAVTGQGNADNNVIYGNALNNTLYGNAGADTLVGGVGADYMAGGSGNDTYYVDNVGDRVVETMIRVGSHIIPSGIDLVNSAINYTIGDFVDNLNLIEGSAATVGTGNVIDNVINGNSAANTLSGLDGADTLFGKAGNDRIEGGEGNDTLTGGFLTELEAKGSDGNDIVNGGGGDDFIIASFQSDTIDGGTGNDTLSFSWVGANLAINLAAGAASFNEAGSYSTPTGGTFWNMPVNTTWRSIENLVGGLGNDTLNGDGGANRLQGGSGNDMLDGRGGGDTLVGDLGDDRFIIRSASDRVTEVAGQGTDTVYAAVNYALTAGAAVENLSTTGNTGLAAINLTGNALAQTITGNDGANRLDSATGAPDTLIGRAGNDAYILRNAGDKITELAGQGADSAATAVSYALGAGVSVETLGTIDGAALTAINLTGNALSQTIIGNAGANRLDSGTGAADTLIGNAGNDSYLVRNAGDKIVETAGQGADWAYAATSYTLGAGVSVEALGTISSTALTAINLTGNALAQTITGNDGANRLDSATGAADTLVGRAGNDSYLVRNAGDKIVELAGQGSDWAYAATSYTLTAGAHVETLSTVSNVGTAAINLAGNELSQTVIGNDGKNLIFGGGGNDKLMGRGGADTFVFNTALNAATNVDTLLDYNAAQDSILLENAVFVGLADGALGASGFFAGAGATAGADSLDRIVYNTTTGALYFDADGAGGAAAVHFATLTGAPTLSNGEFLVI